MRHYLVLITELEELGCMLPEHGLKLIDIKGGVPAGVDLVEKTGEGLLGCFNVDRHVLEGLRVDPRANVQHR